MMRAVAGVAYVEELIDRSPILAFAKDAQGRYLYVNRAWLELCKLRRDDVLGRTDHELFDAETADGFVRNDRRVLEAGATIDVEETMAVDGRVVVGHSTKFPLRDDRGRTCGIGGIAIDITARHEAQVALVRSEQRYRELLEHSPEAYVVLDPTSGRFVETNDNTCSMFKMTRDRKSVV